jgi:hypothetical protein
VVDEGWDEEVRVKVDASEATFVMQDLGKSIDRPCVGAVAGDEGLDYEPRTD